MYISAASGEGLPALEAEISKILETNSLNASDGLLYTERQKDAVRKAEACLQEAKEGILRGVTFDAITVSIEGAIAALWN